MHPKFRLPFNALALVGVASIIISLFYLLSATAFNAIVSLQAISLALSYVPPILFMLIRKARGQPPEYGPFNLGRYGVFVNAFAVVYLIFIIIWMPFPQFLPVNKDTMNYAGQLLGAVIIRALLPFIR